MNNAIRLSIAACATVLVACGGGAKLKPGKENAAAAAFQTSMGAGNAQGSIFDIARQNAGMSGDITVSCPKGGNLTISYVMDSSNNTSGAITFNLKYAACSYDGKTSMTGPMAVTQTFKFGDGSISVQLALKGRVDFSGEISDFVNVDIVETLDASKLKSSEGANVTVVLNGTIQTSSDTYTYSNETFTVTAGRMEAARS